MIKLVVFDWNGTILADARLSWKADDIIFEKFGNGQISFKQFQDTFEIPVNIFYEKNGLSQEKAEANLEEIRETFHNTYEELAKHARTRHGARKLLKWLQKNNIPAVLLSNHTVTGIDHQIKRLKIDNYFAAVLANSTRGDAFHSATKTEKLRKYMETHSYKPEEVMIVGDTVEEYEIGSEMGLKTTLITDGYHSLERLKKCNCDYLINKLPELTKILGEIK
ncbi:HAD family hydrolase [Nanoarchaeota archaeon]